MIYYIYIRNTHFICLMSIVLLVLFELVLDSNALEKRLLDLNTFEPIKLVLFY